MVELLSRLDEFKRNVRQVEHRAIFEVPEILAGILAAHDTPVPWQPDTLGSGGAALTPNRQDHCRHQIAL